MLSYSLANQENQKKGQGQVNSPQTGQLNAVADPGFPEGRGANPQGGDTNLLFVQNFP